MLSAPSPFLIGKQVLRKRNTKILGLIFHHSSSRTLNFSVHQSLCLKCIKARRSCEGAHWVELGCTVWAVGVCFCIWRSRSMVITQACLAQTVLLLRVSLPKFVFCSVEWRQPVDWYEGDKMMWVLYCEALFICQREFLHCIKIGVSSCTCSHFGAKLG